MQDLKPKCFLICTFNRRISQRMAVRLSIPQSTCVCELLSIRQERLNQSRVNNFIPPSWCAVLGCWECLQLPSLVCERRGQDGGSSLSQTLKGRKKWSC